MAFLTGAKVCARTKQTDSNPQIERRKAEDPPLFGPDPKYQESTWRLGEAPAKSQNFAVLE